MFTIHVIHTIKLDGALFPNAEVNAKLDRILKILEHDPEVAKALAARVKTVTSMLQDAANQAPKET